MVTSAIGDVLPLAVAVALSPVPIIAVILMLGTPQARANGPAFAVGWMVGLAAVSTIVLLLTGGADDADSATATGISWLQLVLGLLFLVMAAKQWQKRPAEGEEVTLPEWMSSVDHYTPRTSLGLGLALSGANPKNLALTLGAAASIAQAGLTGGQDVIAVAVFVAIGSASVAGSVLYYLVDTEGAAGPLASMKAFMSAHNAVIMMVMLLILGAKLIGSGLDGVTN